MVTVILSELEVLIALELDDFIFLGICYLASVYLFFRRPQRPVGLETESSVPVKMSICSIFTSTLHQA